MSTISETVTTEHGNYQRVVPVQHATDAGVDRCLALALREFMHRHGVNVSTLTDAELVTAARRGVELRHYQPTSEGGRKK